MKKLCTILFLSVLVCFAAELTVTQTTKVLSSEDTPLYHPTFCPDGSKILVTKENYQGLWIYDLTEKTLVKLNDLAGAGYNPKITTNSDNVVFSEKVFINNRGYSRLVLQSLTNSKSLVELTDLKRSLNPEFSIENNAVIFLDKKEFNQVNYTTGQLSIAKATAVPIVFIENTQLYISDNGTTTKIDPVKNGNYIWPSLSPDNSKILFTAAGKGSYICDLDGNILARLGKAHAPQWSADGEFVVFMVDEDNGDQITSSDIYATSCDGTQTFRLTNTSDIIEMYPHWSPKNNQVICNTIDGDIILMDITIK